MLWGSALSPTQVNGGEYLLDPVFGPTALHFVLVDPAIREELAVTDVQIAQLEQTLVQYRNANFAAMKRSIDQRADGEVVDRKSAILALNRTIHPALTQTLSEQQFQRLQQVCFQKLIRMHEMRPLLYADFIAALELSNDEMIALDRARRVEINKLSEHMSQLNTMHNNRIDQILTAEQQSRFKELYGDPYDLTMSGVSLSNTVDKEFALRCPRLYLLCSEAIRREVELIDEQYPEIKKLQDRFSTRERELKRERRDLQPEARSEYLAKAFEELAQSCMKEEGSILLPHQIRRLNQIVFQVQSSEKDRALTPLTRETVASALNLTDDQRNRLNTEYTEGAERVADELNGSWKQALRTVIESLTPDQQARYHHLVGKPFE
ncbi:MAG: hypothetical protein H8E66_27260 [Planctomycetes bacterium]|nr:hypothetical protein [Planctomycetota bacterium]